MARRVFFSFYYDQDSHRVQQVKNMGQLEGQRILSSNDWEEVKQGGDSAIQAWIAEEMKGTSCLVVLIGSYTAGRKWVNHEIKKAWNDGRGVVGVYIHSLKDLNGDQSTKGRNPFNGFTVSGTNMSSIVKSYDPPYSQSTYVYDYIKENIAAWVEEAIKIRAEY
jgi:hypothetical protein